MSIDDNYFDIGARLTGTPELEMFESLMCYYSVLEVVHDSVVEENRVLRSAIKVLNSSDVQKRVRELHKTRDSIRSRKVFEVGGIDVSEYPRYFNVPSLRTTYVAENKAAVMGCLKCGGEEIPKGVYDLLYVAYNV